jgi:branched-chain amino acid transport system ATP-binding protein
MASITQLSGQARAPIASGDALVLEGITRTFGALRAIEDVSLSVAAGERRALIGANGAGKTTLFNAITGDFPPTAGTVRFFGEDVTALSPHERIRMGLRRTYQSSLLFRNLSVVENLFLAVRGVVRGRFGLLRPRAAHPSRAAAADLLDRVHLTAVADQPVSALSHGQQRQLEIGMALAGAPRLILFDEPAAGLSPAERRELVALLGSLPAHIGFVIIEHDLDVALRVVSHVTVMHDGRVLKHGTPADIEGDAEVQAIYIGRFRSPPGRFPSPPGRFPSPPGRSPSPPGRFPSPPGSRR